MASELFKPRRQEKVAGRLVQALADIEAVDAHKVAELIRLLDARGFVSRPWRRGAAQALQGLADRLQGLADNEIRLLEGWLVNGSDDARPPDAAGAKSSLAGTDVLTGSEARPEVFYRPENLRVVECNEDNFLVLNAIGAGLLLRSPPDVAPWLTVLTRHADRGERSDVWVEVLARESEALANHGGSGVGVLFEKIWSVKPAVFCNPKMALATWQARKVLPERLLTEMLDELLASTDDTLRQAGGEVLAAYVLTQEGTPQMGDRFHLLLDTDPAARLGILFTAGAGWMESTASLRVRSHALLMRFAKTGDLGEAMAVTRVFVASEPVHIDACTLELLDAVADSPAMANLLSRDSFVETLQTALLHPGSESAVLKVCERLVGALESSIEDYEVRESAHHLVGLTIALGRSEQHIRKQAMDLYERLLDRSVVSAEQAALSSLSRGNGMLH